MVVTFNTCDPPHPITPKHLYAIIERSALKLDRFLSQLSHPVSFKRSHWTDVIGS
jgi:hypothetical protein